MKRKEEFREAVLSHIDELDIEIKIPDDGFNKINEKQYQLEVDFSGKFDFNDTSIKSPRHHTLQSIETNLQGIREEKLVISILDLKEGNIFDINEDWIPVSKKFLRSKVGLYEDMVAGIIDEEDGDGIYVGADYSSSLICVEVHHKFAECYIIAKDDERVDSRKKIVDGWFNMLLKAIEYSESDGDRIIVEGLVERSSPEIISVDRLSPKLPEGYSFDLLERGEGMLRPSFIDTA